MKPLPLTPLPLLLLLLSSRAAASQCNDPLKPKAIAELSQMQHAIETARSNKSDALYVESLEGAFQGKLSDVLKKFSLSREQFNELLSQSNTPKEILDHQPKLKPTDHLSIEDQNLIKDAVSYVDTTPGAYIPKLIQQIGQPFFENRKWNDNDRKLFTGLLLLHKHADLLGRNFDINVPTGKNQKVSALHFAADINIEIPLLKEMIDAGADINQTNSDHETILCIACRDDKRSLAEFLLRAGADPNISDSRGATPLLHAIKGNSRALSRLLIEKGAQPNKLIHFVPLLTVAGIRHTIQFYTGKFWQKKDSP